MNLKLQAARDVGSSWLALIVTLVVGFFLFPFILHRLGDEAFGLWVLINSLAGYYGLFDLGIQSSIIRYTARFATTRDKDRMARLISTSIFFYSMVALVSLAVTGACSWYVDSLFHISPNFLLTARLLVLMTGSALALGFPLSVFAGAITGLQKIYLEGLVQTASSLLRALLIVVALGHGGGLLTVALITVVLPLAHNVVYAIAANRTVPIQLSWKFVDWTSFREMITFGSSTFLIGVAGQLRFKTDAAVIGAFLSSSAITFFSVAARLIDYPVRVIQSMAQIFTPMSSRFDATGDMDGLRRMFVEGNRACAMTIFPLSAILIILGKSILEVWVGPKYVSSYPILLVLIMPSTLYYAQATSTRILFGINRHRPLAVVTLVEGTANLALSIALIRPYGILGDALGTAIPLLCTSLFFLPQHLCKRLGIRLTTFLRQAYLAPLGLCTPLVLVLLGLRHLFYAHTYARLLAQVTAGGLVYCIGLIWFFLTKEPIGVKLRAQFAELVENALGR